MKSFKSSDLTHKRAEVFKEAEKDGVIIQLCRTNGDVIQEFILSTKDSFNRDLVKQINLEAKAAWERLMSSPKVLK